MGDKPVIMVCGLGRCGTSATMRMLDVAGVPCIGDRPDYELDEVNHRPVVREWLARFPGHALKLLTPLETKTKHLADLPILTFWLDRNVRQQTLSQAKMIAMAGVPRPTRRRLRAWEHSLRSDRAPSIASLPSPPLHLCFEEMIEEPRRYAQRLADRLSPWWPRLDVIRMAEIIIPRSADCAPDMEIEEFFVAAAAHG